MSELLYMLISCLPALKEMVWSYWQICLISATIFSHFLLAVSTKKWLTVYFWADRKPHYSRSTLDVLFCPSVYDSVSERCKTKLKQPLIQMTLRGYTVWFHSTCWIRAAADGEANTPNVFVMVQSNTQHDISWGFLAEAALLQPEEWLNSSLPLPDLQ